MTYSLKCMDAGICFKTLSVRCKLPHNSQLISGSETSTSEENEGGNTPVPYKQMERKIRSVALAAWKTRIVSPHSPLFLAV